METWRYGVLEVWTRAVGVATWKHGGLEALRALRAVSAGNCAPCAGGWKGRAACAVCAVTRCVLLVRGRCVIYAGGREGRAVGADMCCVILVY